MAKTPPVVLMLSAAFDELELVELAPEELPVEVPEPNPDTADVAEELVVVAVAAEVAEAVPNMVVLPYTEALLQFSSFSC